MEKKNIIGYKWHLSNKIFYCKECYEKKLKNKADIPIYENEEILVKDFDGKEKDPGLIICSNCHRMISKNPDYPQIFFNESSNLYPYPSRLDIWIRDPASGKIRFYDFSLGELIKELPDLIKWDEFLDLFSDKFIKEYDSNEFDKDIYHSIIADGKLWSSKQKYEEFLENMKKLKGD